MLYACGFLFGMRSGILMVTWPWWIMNILHGGSAAVGAIGAVWTLGYIIFCLLIGPHADKVNARKMIMMAMTASACLITIMPLMPSVALLLMIIGIEGAASGMIWPPLMGWLSVGHQGRRLNKRITFFSFSAYFGSVIGYSISGWLWSKWSSHLLPYITTVIIVIGAIIMAASAYHRKANPIGQQWDKTGKLPPEATIFRIMSIIAVIIAGAAFGTIQFPMVSLMKQMGFGPKIHAPIGASIGIAVMCGFFLLGRTTRWHYKKLFFWGIQVIIAIMVLAISTSVSAWQLGVYSVTAAFGISVYFISDLYYAVSITERRIHATAIHEICTSGGYMIGSFGGGALARLIGLRQIFPVMAGVIILALIAQIFIYYRKRPIPLPTSKPTDMTQADENTQQYQKHQNADISPTGRANP